MSKPKHKPSKKTKKQTPKKKKIHPMMIILLVAALALIGWVVVNKSDRKSRKTNTHKVGAANGCKKSPAFVAKYGLQQPVLIDLRQKEATGLKILEARQNGKSIALPEWSSAGHLGPYALDKKGNIYLAPVPHVSLTENKPEEQNRVYIVDSQTGKFSLFYDFPAAAPPTPANPYGVTSLAYDCDTESLYVSSIAGSSPDSERGRIFQFDLKTKTIVSQLENVDALGIGLFNTSKGKKLFIGSSRTSEIFSVALDNKGAFAKDVKFEWSLAAQEGGSSDKAHRIRFFPDNHMEIKAIEFSYSLMVASDPMRNIYNFDYNAAEDNWIFRDVHKQEN